MRAKILTWISGLGRDRWNALARAFGVLIAYGIVYFSIGLPVGIGFFIYAHSVAGDELREVPLHMEDSLLFLHATATLLILLIMALVIAFMLRRFDRRGSFAEIGIRIGKGAWQGVVLSLIAASALFMLIFLAAWAMGMVRFVGTAWEEALWGDILIDFLGYIVLLAAIALTEELVFRGYLRYTLTQAFSPKSALVISAVLFAISRAVMASSGALGSLNAVLSGLILGMLFIVTGSLWVPIAAHFAWILVEGYIFSFPTSGMATEGLVRIKFVSGLLLDSSYGPQGGLLVLFAFLAVAVGLWFYTGKHLRTGAASISAG